MKNNSATSVNSAELADLRERLAEAEAVLYAIHHGEVDALMISGVEGEQVHTISGAYRQIIDSISEGAVNLSDDGIILYCNVPLAELLGWPIENIMGTPLRDYMFPKDQQLLAALLNKARTKSRRMELSLKTSDGRLTPVYLSASRLLNRNEEAIFSLVITDLTEQKKHEKVVEAERLARLILEQAAEAIIVCDENGIVIRISQAARQFCNENPLSFSFAEVFPLQTGTPNPLLLDSILSGKSLRNIDVSLEYNEQVYNLILNAAPLISGKKILGCVIILADITERKQAEKILQAHNEERERFNRAAVGRELRMITLKKEINDLRRKLDQSDLYTIHPADPGHSFPELQKKGWLKNPFGRRRHED